MKISNFLSKILPVALLAGSLFSCTKLDEELQSTLTPAQANSLITAAGGSSVALNGTYNDLAVPFNNQDQVFSLQENTTDECLVPTRGSDWDDNGVWRVLHSHNWDANHGQVTSVFNNLLKIVFDATNTLTFNPTKKEAAEAKFLRAFAMFTVLDLYGQVPYREPGDNLLNAPNVLKGPEAMDFIISELNAILADLDPANPPYRATPDAAKVLLMKCYLNKGALTNRESPSFDDADMQQVITIGQSIMSGGQYSFTPDYFDNFGSNNDISSNENIFTYQNITGASNNSGVNSRWMMTLHYNSWAELAPNAGWNGFSTLSDFYNLFNQADRRIGGSYAGVTDVSGLKVGMLVGQQYNADGSLVQDRKGNPLIFTPEVKLKITDAEDIESAGIRVIKYPPDYEHYASSARNDLVFYRYSDVVLMVAEAQLRTNNAGDALTHVNSVRIARGEDPLTSLDLDKMLAERGREFYWESQRRTDLIRFGKFLEPWQGKPTDDPKYLYFPIPNSALAVNPNLEQNPGYGG